MDKCYSMETLSLSSLVEIALTRFGLPENVRIKLFFSLILSDADVKLVSAETTPVPSAYGAPSP